ncbi:MULTISPECIES: DUF6602 domain-containing protein [Xanthomonas]|uniref:DUF6602 domain-containing protein n=1 Tax=Xanthomonas TaxID=338 RepID=UPI001ADBFEB0|nr:MULTISPECIES: DUF6602 domain-containing protein [unclassified Xanthomonas]MBO9875424.1 hypothetical protein [Xanthomonas sp. D-93]WNH45377.1 hypothetical protein PG878_02595 [Xanthomonas sp. A6251]
MDTTTSHAMQALALNTAKKFRDDYLTISRHLFRDEEQHNGLLHAGEFGIYREQLLRTLLASHLPSRLSIGSGFLSTPQQPSSTQCDLVIYDRDATPSLDLAGGRVFFPTETCAAVGEVKSALKFSALCEALQKLAETKRLRAAHCPPGLPVAPVDAVFRLWEAARSQSIAPPALEALRRGLFQPDLVEQQNLVTFLVCERIEWPSGEAPDSDGFHRALAKLYPRSVGNYHLRHNLLLSLQDGLLSYYSAVTGDDGQWRNVPYFYPRRGQVDCGWRWLPASDDALHILMFAAECAASAARTWIYEFSSVAHLDDGHPLEFVYTQLS